MQAREVLDWLERQGSRRAADGLTRYGIRTESRVVGVPVGTLQKMAKRLGRDHRLARGLWSSGWYEARMLAALVDEPGEVTRRQMNEWAADFDNWAICDTACFHLFDRTPHAWQKARQWARSRREFVKRAAFALMASLTVHDKGAQDKEFLGFLPLIEDGAIDERNFVSKAVNWALRSIGKRSRVLHSAACATAQRLAGSDQPAPRWVGKDALRELKSPKVIQRVSRR